MRVWKTSDMDFWRECKVKKWTRYLAKKYCPFDGIIVRVSGGFIVFESPDDYKIWYSQR